MFIFPPSIQIWYCFTVFCFFLLDESQKADESKIVKAGEKKLTTLPLLLISKLLYVADAEKPGPSH